MIKNHLKRSLKDDISDDDDNVKIKARFNIVFYSLHISLKGPEIIISELFTIWLTETCISLAVACGEAQT